MKTYVIPGNLDDIFANTNPAVQVAKALKGLDGIEVYSAIAIKVQTPEDEAMVERALILSEAKFEVIAARAEAAERERDALRDRLRWIPVEERLPEDNEYVLGAERHGCQCYTVWLYHHVLRELFVRAFSHWMPLPEPPEGGEG